MSLLGPKKITGIAWSSEGGEISQEKQFARGMSISIKVAADDLHLPLEIIQRLVHANAAWRDGVSWRVSVERRLWALTETLRVCGFRIGAPVRFVVLSWAAKHGATDHTSTTNLEVCGWVAGEDMDGMMVVDEQGIVWMGLDGITIGALDETIVSSTMSMQNIKPQAGGGDS
jgi:hypothetical protein